MSRVFYILSGLFSFSFFRARRLLPLAPLADHLRVFYLATDDFAVKNEICRRFGGKVLTLPTPTCRKSLAGIQNAVVDLWCLAHTKRLIGSYWSSFTDTAAELGRIPVTIVRKSAQ